MDSLIRELLVQMPSEAKVLTQDRPEFEEAHQRWTDIDRKTPAVIVQPTSEYDVATLVSSTTLFYNSP